MREEHPCDGQAEGVLLVDWKDLGLTEMLVTLIEPRLQKLIEEVYARGREDAHHELVCELEGGSVSRRKWPGHGGGDG